MTVGVGVVVALAVAAARDADATADAPRPIPVGRQRHGTPFRQALTKVPKYNRVVSINDSCNTAQ